nr:hypothetical protein [Tanacetum cinerariifolium]
MASSSSSPSLTNDPEYDVYLSFFGADTRLSFTAHLCKTLEDANLQTFLDEKSIREGELLKFELVRAIQKSRVSIIVLSKNYASSEWCLDELVLILNQHRHTNHIVIPVFYHVEPTDVRKQQSSFGDAMEKHKQKMEAETNAERKSQLAQRMEIWKEALKEIANIVGYHYIRDRRETENIEEIVVNIYRRLSATRCSSLPDLIGMKDQIDFISLWLRDGSSHTTDILSILGMGGIGKTSLAQYVYVKHRHIFDARSFISNISSTMRSEQSDKLLNMQKQFFSQISETSSVQVNNVFDYTAEIKNALQGKKVLVVLDDVVSLDHLNVLLGDEGFYPGSKIIITTRDASLTNRYLLFNPLVQPNHTTLTLNNLDETSSLQLLCFYAFKRSGPTEDYEQLCKMIVKFCEGLPLALTVLGSFLCGKDVEEWKSHVARLNHETDSKIIQTLRISFDALPSQNEKELFLHISCFFVEMDTDITETILNACDISTIFGIRTLVQMCLLTIGPANKLTMHPLLQEMGRDVGSANLLGLALDMKQEEDNLHESVEIETDAFSKMENLMLLQLNYVKLTGSYKNFPEELRWLCMHGFPLQSIPSDLPMENLVALDLSYSKIEVFDMSYSNPQQLSETPTLIGPSSNDESLLGSLKILNLSFCEQLHTVGGFVKLPALEKFIVSNCTGLIKVSGSIEHCVELVTIDLSHCNKLEALPTNLGKLKKLKTLLLDGPQVCFKPFSYNVLGPLLEDIRE